MSSLEIMECIASIKLTSPLHYHYAISSSNPCNEHNGSTYAIGGKTDLLLAPPPRDKCRSANDTAEVDGEYTRDAFVYAKARFTYPYWDCPA